MVIWPSGSTLHTHLPTGVKSCTQLQAQHSTLETKHPTLETCFAERHKKKPHVAQPYQHGNHTCNDAGPLVSSDRISGPFSCLQDSRLADWSSGDLNYDPRAGYLLNSQLNSTRQDSFYFDKYIQHSKISVVIRLIELEDSTTHRRDVPGLLYTERLYRGLCTVPPCTSTSRRRLCHLLSPETPSTPTSRRLVTPTIWPRPSRRS